MHQPTGSSLSLARRAAALLERLSVDSHWAYRASGLRRSLMRCIDEAETGTPDEKARARDRLAILVEQAFFILEKSAREIGDREH
jgi:hypothetical protein